MAGREETEGLADEPEEARDAEAARPTAIIVVSDKEGFVGGFYSPEEAASVAARWAEAGEPLLFQQFGVAESPLDTLWVVPYLSTDAVAFVSNGYAAAEEARRCFARVGLAGDDPVDYWETPAGQVAVPAEKRVRLALDRKKAGAPGQPITPDQIGQLLGRLGALGLAPAAPSGSHPGGANPLLISGGIGQFIVPVAAPSSLPGQDEENEMSENHEMSEMGFLEGSSHDEGVVN